MFSGEADGSTPPWIAAAATRLLTNGRQINAAHTGHQIDGPCTWNLMQAFFTDPVTQKVDPSCLDVVRRPAFVIDSLN